MTTKQYEVEFKSTTYRQFVVDAKNRAEAEEKAWEELELDTEIPSAWVEDAKVHTIIGSNDPEAQDTWGLNSKGKLKNDN
jgi:hypothetical protein